ncbi:hypothetical protein ESCO_006258 [Escovopsis weberi]|uniref:MICOS complex subunit MIC12 n=1 Tax=Escovopsis weberi TaxID=150374 RepID=A0A0M9VUV6_ESCWE|nr:hypothetical protein ESCO_006258 [Escovopsis weberi]
MGFATGFSGGVALTLSVAYLTMLAHRRNRETQSEIIRAQAISIRSLLDPPPPPLPPRRSEVAAAQREHMMEVAKDRWNAEVLNAVRWVQRTDWAGVREGMEERAGYLWGQAFGDEEKKRKNTEARPLAERTRAGVARAGGYAAEATSGALNQAREVAEQIELSAENAALDARLRSRRALGEKAAQAREVIAEAVEKSEQTARTAVRLAEAQVEEMVGDERGRVEQSNKERKRPSPVEKALSERFGRTRDTRSIQEVLRERYVPMDQRDNTLLRGL